MNLFQGRTSKLKRSYYVQNQSKKSIPDLVSEARISLQRKNRTIFDYEIIEGFLLTLNFVQKLKQQHGPLVVQNLCRNLSYQKIQANQPSITNSQDHQQFRQIKKTGFSMSFYLARLGFHYWSRNPKDYQSSKKGEKRSSESSNIDTPRSSQQLDEEFFRLQEIKVLGQGDSFGELALLKDNSRATATVITKTECEFGILTRKQYHEVLGKISKGTYYEKLTFLERFPLFKQWESEDLKQLSYYFTLKKYQRKEKAFIEGQENSQLFIVRSGVFQIMKRYKNQNIQISYLQKNELYLEIPIEPTYNYTLECDEDESELYELAHYDFRKFIDENNLDEFIQYAESRGEWRKRRFQQIIQEAQFKEDERENFRSVKKELMKTITLYQELRVPIREKKKAHSVKRETKNQKQHKLAQIALKKNQIYRGHQSDDEDFYTLPAIRNTSSSKKIWVDLIDVEKSFESLDNYQISKNDQYNLYYQ